MSLDPEDPKVRTAVFGKQVENFLQSDIGTYLLQMADHEVNQYTEQLVAKCHEMTPQELLACQSKVWRAQAFQDWLAQAIQAGQLSEAALEDERG